MGSFCRPVPTCPPAASLVIKLSLHLLNLSAVSTVTRAAVAHELRQGAGCPTRGFLQQNAVCKGQGAGVCSQQEATSAAFASDTCSGITTVAARSASLFPHPRPQQHEACPLQLKAVLLWRDVLCRGTC